MKNNVEKKFTILLVTMLALSVSVGIVNAEDVQLVIITPHWEGIVKEFEVAFQEYYLETHGQTVNIDWIDVGGTSDDVKYLDSAYSATPDGVGIDLFFGGGVDPYIAAKEKGQLQTYEVDSSILDKIPATIAGIPMYDSEYYWYGAALSGFGIIYNKAVLALEGLPEPETWADLANPELKGWVGSADPGHSGSTHMAYEIILQAYGWEAGWELITQMGANVKNFVTSSSSVPKSVGAGDIAYGLAIDFYAWSEVSKVGADKIGYVMPTGLTVINPDSIAILKGAPNLEVAQRFVDFVLSEQAQKLWMLPVGEDGGPTTYLLGRMGIIPDLYTELGSSSIVPINPFDVESSLDYDPVTGSRRYSLVNDLVGSMIIDTQSSLSATWGEIIAIENTLIEADVTSTKIEEAKVKLGEAPLTESEALMAADQWSDATVRNQYISEWHEFAETKYKSASNLANLASTELLDYFETILDNMESENQNNLYTGLGGGALIGVILGYLISSYMSRQKEISAVGG